MSLIASSPKLYSTRKVSSGIIGKINEAIFIGKRFLATPAIG
ncbi:hypothetical protein HID58_041512 [Brassica napus]|uniref:Uncharacterized protein n=1 Tax=Brassica napus TaxID=3708 RepID=A0ABQ8BB22_BRANA|nr:hypothetical protein HID58_041512 [Brassica napus]